MAKEAQSVQIDKDARKINKRLTHDTLYAHQQTTIQQSISMAWTCKKLALTLTCTLELG